MVRATLPAVSILAVLLMGLAMAQPFEGTQWKIKLTPDEDSRRAGEKEMADTISFKGNKFNSEALAKLGFAAITYEEDPGRMGGPATFKADAKSDTNGTAKWSGTVVIDQIKGQLVWTKKDDKQVTFSFQGEKVRQ